MTQDHFDAIKATDMQIEERSPGVGSAMAIGDNSPFVIVDKTNENPHNNDGCESTVSELATDNVKLLPLPQTPVRARTDARTNPSIQRATKLRSVLARVYDVSIQNQITTTVP
jgi:hypothetical protein